ncbi:hypothetical protein ACEN4E_06050 [Latilactobacillus sakei]
MPSIEDILRINKVWRMIADSNHLTFGVNRKNMTDRTRLADKNSTNKKGAKTKVILS